MWKVLIHNVVEKTKDHFPEVFGVTVTGTGVITDNIIFLNSVVELIVKLGYIAVSVITVVYLIRKIKTIKK